MLAICEQNGWTYEQWHALSDDEQTDRLAYRYHKQLFLDELIAALDTRIANEQTIEQTAYIQLLMKRHTT